MHESNDMINLKAPTPKSKKKKKTSKKTTTIPKNSKKIYL